MGLVRFIVLAVIIWIVWGMFKNYQTKQQKKQKPQKLANDKMVKCQYCEVHLPASEAYQHQDLWFCNQDHYKKFPASKSD